MRALPVEDPLEFESFEAFGSLEEQIFAVSHQAFAAPRADGPPLMLESVSSE